MLKQNDKTSDIN